MGLGLAEARRWARAGVPVRDAVRARAAGLTLGELGAWEAEGFNAADAAEAKEAGLDVPAVAAWREAGFVVPDAMQLVRDGWSLADAVVARYTGIRGGHVSDAMARGQRRQPGRSDSRHR
jgi:hypothetical protein